MVIIVFHSSQGFAGISFAVLHLTGLPEFVGIFEGSQRPDLGRFLSEARKA
jgi:hypothetical protein